MTRPPAKKLYKPLLPPAHHCRHHSPTSADSFQNPIHQLLTQLALALSAAASQPQSAYTSLQQEFQALRAPVSSTPLTNSPPLRVTLLWTNRAPVFTLLFLHSFILLLFYSFILLLFDSSTHRFPYSSPAISQSLPFFAASSFSNASSQTCTTFLSIVPIFMYSRSSAAASSSFPCCIIPFARNNPAVL